MDDLITRYRMKWAQYYVAVDVMRSAYKRWKKGNITDAIFIEQMDHAFVLLAPPKKEVNDG